MVCVICVCVFIVHVYVCVWRLEVNVGYLPQSLFVVGGHLFIPAARLKLTTQKLY